MSTKTVEGGRERKKTDLVTDQNVVTKTEA